MFKITCGYAANLYIVLNLETQMKWILFKENRLLKLYNTDTNLKQTNFPRKS